MVKNVPVKNEQQLMTDILSFKDDPLGYVMYAFPWGRAGTPLANNKQPRKWQVKILEKIAIHIKEDQNRIARGENPEVLYIARSSGRGIGKSALMAMVDMWFMSTHLGGTSITTANTEPQLVTRTFAELGKWHTMSINSHWFDKTAMKLVPSEWFGEMIKTQLSIDTGLYYSAAQTWSEENPDAFAGVHNTVGGMLLKFDESSGIPPAIWDVSEGFFTDPIPYRIWMTFSNPRRNTGMFFECFHKNRDYWDADYIDARTVENVDLTVYERIIAMNGPDSYEANVEVYGKFPETGEKQFIGYDLVDGAQDREIFPDSGVPLLLGVDVARFGDDASVLFFRKGRDGRSIPPLAYKSLSLTEVSNRVAEAISKYKVDYIFVDGAGVGGGVVDILRSRGFKVFDINGGSSPTDKNCYVNLRAEMWDKMKKWLETCSLYKDENGICRIKDDLISLEYDYDDRHRLKLELKKQMKSRGLASPDYADALALTFAVNVGRVDAANRSHRRLKRTTEYDIFGVA